MFEELVQGFFNLFEPTVLMAWIAGSLLGITVGVIPTLGGLEAAALLLVFIFKMDPFIALPFMLALMSVAFTGGAITSILVNIPGTGANAATLIDGYPMTRKGQPGRAIGAAITSSAMGGIITVPMALLMVPLVIPLVMALWSAELFFLVVLGLSFLAILGKGGQVKGLIAGGLGILISFMGLQQSTGMPRFTFGTIYFFDGVDLIPVVLGIFGLAEIIDLVIRRQSIAPIQTVLGSRQDIFEGAKDVFRHIWLWFRCSILGYVIGVIPGIGAGMATFAAYGHAKQTSKHPEQFGTGAIEGVIAPEAANNAKEAGSVLTTLAFGIPGSAEMTILLGAFLMVGIVPGPGMLLDHLELSFTMLLCIVVANVLAVVVCFFAAPYLIRLVSIHPFYLFSILLTLIFVGCFVRGETMFNIPVVIAFGLIGYFMKRFDFPRPALALGYILGGLFEHYFFMSLRLEGPLFFLRPISLVLIFIIIGVLSQDYIRSRLKRWRGVKRV